jgi:four helix bundle protein
VEWWAKRKKTKLIEKNRFCTQCSIFPVFHHSNWWAACLAQLKASFVSKISIVLEEADESYFWLEFIIDENLLKRNLVEPLLKEADELIAIFIASRRTAKN